MNAIIDWIVITAMIYCIIQLTITGSSFGGIIWWRVIVLAIVVFLVVYCGLYGICKLLGCLE